jgi:hypothetical protein
MTATAFDVIGPDAVESFTETKNVFIATGE